MKNKLKNQNKTSHTPAILFTALFFISIIFYVSIKNLEISKKEYDILFNFIKDNPKDQYFKNAIKRYSEDGKITVEEYDEIQRLLNSNLKRKQPNPLKFLKDKSI